MFGEILCLAELPLGVLPADRNFGVPDPFDGLDPQDTDLTYLVELLAFDPEITGGFYGPPVPIGTLGLGSFEYSYRGAERIVYLGDHHNYQSLPGDSPANTSFRGVLDPAYGISARLGGAADPLGGAQVDIGTVGIVNGNGFYDFLLRCAFGGRPVQVKVGKQTWSYNTFKTALYGIATAPRDGEATINIGLTTILSLLEGNIERRYWLGIGGADGSADLAGRPIPILWGYGRSLPGILEDPSANIWRFAEALGSMTNPRNRGVGGFEGGSDYANWAALAAASVPPGHWATCVSEGRARYGSPVTLPTVDAEGIASVGNLAGDIVLHIAQNRLGAQRNLSDARIDPGAFGRLDALRPWETGIYIDGDVRARDVLDQLMRDVGAALVSTRDGLLSCVPYAVPELAPAEISAADIDTSGVIPVRVAPAKRVTVTFAPRIRPLGGGEMPDSVSAEDRSDLAAIAQYAASTRSPPDTDAVAYAIATGLRYQADAADLAAIAADLMSRFTHYYTVPLVGRPFLHWLGDIRRLTYDRFGASAGLDCIVVGLVESNAGGNQIILWGPRGN